MLLLFFCAAAVVADTLRTLIWKSISSGDERPRPQQTFFMCARERREGGCRPEALRWISLCRVMEKYSSYFFLFLLFFSDGGIWDGREGRSLCGWIGFFFFFFLRERIVGY